MPLPTPSFNTAWIKLPNTFSLLIFLCQRQIPVPMISTKLDLGHQTR